MSKRAVLCIFLAVITICSTCFAQEPDEVGMGGCYTMGAIDWPACDAIPNTCAFTLGTPEDQSPGYEYISGVWFQIPSWNYVCPEAARGVMQPNGVPAEMCYVKSTSGKTAQVKSSYVCFRTTGCHQEAVKSNMPHATKKGTVFEFIPFEGGDVEFEGMQGYWDDIGEIFARTSNCTGDAYHPLDSFPTGDVALSCNTINCVP